jgi:hypothetical protein
MEVNRMEQDLNARPSREVFDTDGAAEYIGCSPGHLIKLRQLGGGPEFHRLFRRKGIRYTREDIDRWHAERRYGSTTEYPEAFA